MFHKGQGSPVCRGGYKPGLPKKGSRGRLIAPREAMGVLRSLQVQLYSPAQVCHLVKMTGAILPARMARLPRSL